MGLKIVYYGLIIPASKLPFGVMYWVSDVLSLFLSYIIKYRKDVAIQNLKRAFPNISDERLNEVLRKNSRHVSDILLEGTKNMTMSEKQLKSRIVFKNTEIFDKYYQEGKSVILMGSHCNNWEYIITAQNLYLPHLAIGIGQPLTNQFFNVVINEQRARFGMKVVHAKTYKEEIENNIAAKNPVSVLVLADQSPPNIHRAYWGKMFGVDTPFAYGGELLARKYNLPVVYLKNTKVKRGYYEVEPVLLSENPQGEPYGGIMDKYIRTMEEQILSEPQNWLWTHKRWKHQPPENLEEVKRQNLETFQSKNKAGN
ncbi:MAG: lysophospholipid acyltransferase family protein [Crocinitomicaceae bacterium]|nr:lysophospholipid acyltransferase family protein [Crocinitomicaceae bacterium]